MTGSAIAIGGAGRRPGRRERAARLERRIEQGRSRAESMLALAGHLPESDRVLIEAVYRDGLTARSIARLRGAPCVTVRRRLARIVDRMESFEFRLAASQGRTWPAERWAVVRAVVLEGRTLRESAAMLGITLHATRREVAHVRALAEAARQSRRSA